MRIWVRSASPSIVTDIDVLALGASSKTRSQGPSPPPDETRPRAENRRAPPSPPLGGPELVRGGAATLREAAGRAPRGIGALAATTLARSRSTEAEGEEGGT